MASTPLFVATPRQKSTLFVPGFSTRPRIILAPGASGTRLYGVTGASTDGASNTVQISMGERLTLQSAMGTGHVTDGGGSSDTITRTSGSFVTDGWRAGDRMLIQGATTLANDFAALLTAVTALTLTFATSTVNTDEDLPSGAALYRLTHLCYATLAASAGVSATAAAQLITSTNLPTWDGERDLGSGDYLVAALGTALTSGETADIVADAADF